MYGGFVLMFMAALIVLSPFIWLAWWMLADLGEGADRRPRPV